MAKPASRQVGVHTTAQKNTKPKADSEYDQTYDEEARKERMKAKQNWQLIGRFIATLVKLTTLVSAVFKRAEVGLEVLDWLVDGGKEHLHAMCTNIAEEYKKQNPPDVDNIIKVDRSVHLTYPDWVKMVMHPELESTGPAEYTMDHVEQWLHDGQKGGKWVKGQVIYDYLVENDILMSCFGLRDLEEIQKKGIAFFRKHFKGKAVFGWKGVVRDRHGGLNVPYLCESGGGVVLYWYWIGGDWDDYDPALRLASTLNSVSKT